MRITFANGFANGLIGREGLGSHAPRLQENLEEFKQLGNATFINNSF